MSDAMLNPFTEFYTFRNPDYKPDHIYAKPVFQMLQCKFMMLGKKMFPDIHPLYSEILLVCSVTFPATLNDSLLFMALTGKHIMHSPWAYSGKEQPDECLNINF